jgi:predicted DNA helicase
VGGLQIKVKEYVKRLLELVEMERKAEIEAMISEIRRLSASKREKIGRAINNLDGKVLGRELGFTLVKYGRKKPIETEISVGDLVLISRGNPLRSDLTGTVAQKGGRFIIVALERVPRWALKNVRIDLYANDITFQRMEDNLKKLNRNTYNVLEFLLGKRKPTKVRRVEFELEDENLNNSQREAISRALASKDFFLIHGPFGTGKTRTLIELILQEVKRGGKLLVTAESNMAVDNILEGLDGKVECVRLGHPQRVSRENIEKSLAYKVENHPDYEKISELEEKVQEVIGEREKYHKPTPALRRGLSDRQILANAMKRRGSRGISPNVMISMAKWIKANRRIDRLYQMMEDIENNIVADILEETPVILSTNSSAALEYLDGVSFDLIVVDEASQATIPSILIPLSRGGRFVLAGDHKQLPPTILNQDAVELEKTLFEELIRLYPYKAYMLDVQYRMNPQLMEFPNMEFYDNRIKAAPGLEDFTIEDLVDDTSCGWELGRELLDPGKPLLFIDTADMEGKFERRVKGSPSLQNQLEADLAVIVSNFFIRRGVKPSDIGIITPYDDQVDLISSHAKVEVNTVDGYQGREKEIIIISMVRSNKEGRIGFLSDLRRLNVSLTRARRKLVIIGDSDTLQAHPSYRRLIRYSIGRGFYYRLGVESVRTSLSNFSG